jgi:2-methylcitrate dehydratase PrpD
MLHAIGSAGTTAAGLWEFLRDAADAKQLHTAHAVTAGMQAAYLAQAGFTGAQRILEGAQGMGAGMSQDADASKLVDRLGVRWALIETSFKFHASCRHTHPAADALQAAMKNNGLTVDQIESVVTHVHQGAIDVLGPVTDPQTVHQSKFSMGTVLALIALNDAADLKGFDEALGNEVVTAFRDRVSMVLDDEVDGAYPQRWIGKVTVTTKDGQTFDGRVDEPKGDPGNTLSRPEIEEKVMRLGTYKNAAPASVVRTLTQKAWGLRNLSNLNGLLS